MMRRTWRVGGLILGLLAAGCAVLAAPSPTPEPSEDDDEITYLVITATPAPTQTPAPTPDFPALIESSQAALLAGDADAALAALEELQAIRATQQAHDGWVDAVSAFYNAGAYADAAAVADAGLVHYPDDSALLFLSGTVALTQDDTEDAVERFGQLLDQNPDDFRSYHLRGIAHMRAGDVEEAIPDFEQAVALGEAAGVAGNSVAFEAIADLANALAVEDEQAGLLYLQEKRVFYRDNFYGALPGAFLAGQARIYTRPDQNEIALDMLNRAIQRNYVEGYYYRAQVWDRMGETEKAVRDLEDYLEVRPVGVVSEWARDLLAELQGS